MAKPLPLIVGVLGIGATATGGYMLVKNRGSEDGTGTGGTTTTSTNETPATPSAGPGVATGSQTGQQSGGGASGGPGASTGNPAGKAEEKKIIFETLDEFKKDSKKSECLKSDFSGLTLEGEVGDNFEAGKPAADKFFKSPDQGSTPDTKSCLTINWKKVKGTQNDKWAGKFAWLWIFIRGDEGFVNFNLMEPGTDGKVKFAGGFYLVEKSTSSQKWEVKNRKEVKDKEVEVTSLGEHVPKAHTDFKTTVSLNKDYWDYVDDWSKLNEMCKDDEACSEQPEVKQYQWTIESTSDTGKPVNEWSENLTWWEKIYEVHSHWKLDEKVKTIKGKWTAA